MRLTDKLLRKNISGGRIAGFALSNFIGLLIVAGAVTFYVDSRSIWTDTESFVRSDVMVINKKVTSANTLGGNDAGRFTAEEISELEGQPWVRRTGAFMASDFRVYASVSHGGRGMETAMFFESVPDGFVDGGGSDWHYGEGDTTVPLIISKDYLTLYNFGFAGSAGLPQLSEQLISGIPLQLYLRSEDGERNMRLTGRIVGFSNRINTVLVPESFMRYANSRLGTGSELAPSRLIVDVSSPGDVAIGEFLDTHRWEVAGDKTGSSATFLLKTVTGTVIAVGAVITLLSLFVLMLSVSLLMEKNRNTIHRLLMLGTPLRQVGAPYRHIIIAGCGAAFVAAMAALAALRGYYLPAIEGLGGGGHGLLWGAVTGLALTAVVVVVNVAAVGKKVRNCLTLNS